MSEQTRARARVSGDGKMAREVNPFNRNSDLDEKYKDFEQTHQYFHLTTESKPNTIIDVELVPCTLSKNRYVITLDPDYWKQQGFQIYDCYQPIEEVKEEEQGVKEVQGWISVKDRLPKIGEHYTILVFGSYTRDCPQRVTQVHYYKRGKFIDYRNMDGSRTKNVTHWMPLPHPPKIENDERNGR